MKIMCIQTSRLESHRSWQSDCFAIYTYQELDGKPYKTTPLSVVRPGLAASLQSANEACLKASIAKYWSTKLLSTRF